MIVEKPAIITGAMAPSRMSDTASSPGGMWPSARRNNSRSGGQGALPAASLLSTIGQFFPALARGLGGAEIVRINLPVAAFVRLEPQVTLRHVAFDRLILIVAFAPVSGLLLCLTLTHAPAKLQRIVLCLDSTSGRDTGVRPCFSCGIIETAPL